MAVTVFARRRQALFSSCSVCGRRRADPCVVPTAFPQNPCEESYQPQGSLPWMAVQPTPSSETIVPVQEALITTAAGLAEPCGVSFRTPGDKYGTKESDTRTWAAAVATAADRISRGWMVMVLIQTRTVRSWNAQLMQFNFMPAEDYLIAGWLVSPSLGSPYRPGTVMEKWFAAVDARLGSEGETPKVFSFWNAAPASCTLSTRGPIHMITSQVANSGKTEVEAISIAKNQFVNSAKYGWQGGNFPKSRWIGAAPASVRGTVALGTQGAPTYQAPLPPPRRR